MRRAEAVCEQGSREAALKGAHDGDTQMRRPSAAQGRAGGRGAQVCGVHTVKGQLALIRGHTILREAAKAMREVEAAQHTGD